MGKENQNKKDNKFGRHKKTSIETDSDSDDYHTPKKANKVEKLSKKKRTRYNGKNGNNLIMISNFYFDNIFQIWVMKNALN